ncbi:MAG: biosynthetic peptidoglycan transglycosylase [Bacteriovoracaceae bacterium]|jgi:monofunctional biosynthetic peptidoglycan transglycosylase|nr:biosynthetic peptidoglycan transglycosylase [Bacteriovoracaceae bacterium]
MKKKYFFIFVIAFVTIIGGASTSYYFYLNQRAQLLQNHYPVWNAKKTGYVLTKKKPSHWVDLKRISYEAQWAIIISEDWAFYEHEGIDFNQLKIVLEESLKAGEFVRGASTITQQVVKNALLTHERTLTRKFQEILLANLIEQNLSKKKILEIYLNLVELGKNLYGIKKAAKFYFHKHPSKLTAKEGAFLAMLLPSPVKYAQSYRNRELTEFGKQQVSNILKKLKQAKIISEEKRKLLDGEPLSFEAVNAIDEDILSFENESYE